MGDASYEDQCDSVFDGAFLTWNAASARGTEDSFQVDAAPFLAAGWQRTAPELVLEPGDVHLEKKVDGRDFDVLFTCDTGGGGGGGACEAWADVDR